MINQSLCSAQGQGFHCKLNILHSTLFSAFLFVSAFISFIMMLSNIWYLLLPRKFFPFTIPCRASFYRRFLLSQWPSKFLFLFFISSSIILLSPTLPSIAAFLFCLSILHAPSFSISTSQMFPVVFAHYIVVSAPYNATLHTKHFSNLLLNIFSKSPQKMLLFLYSI